MNALSICHLCLAKRRIRCNGPCPCPEDGQGRDIVVHAADRSCPIGNHSDSAIVALLVPEKTKQPDYKWGAPLWAEFHARADVAELDIGKELAWLDAFDGRIPCGACRVTWLAMRKANPPDLSSPAAYRDWGVAMHNRVNAAIGKPEFAVPLG